MKNILFKLFVLNLLFLGFAYSQEKLFIKGYNAYKNDDYENAIKYNKKACDLNDSYGCFILGNMYGQGQGVRKDINKALEFYGKACDLESEKGCQNYARLKN